MTEKEKTPPEPSARTQEPPIQKAAPAPRPERALIGFTRKDFDLLRELRGTGLDLGAAFGGIQAVAWPDLLLVGPVLGAPQAALVLEYLRLNGVKTVVGLGWCGSLQPALSIGRIILPEAAVSEEGTSAHYPLAQGPAGANRELADRLSQALSAREIPFRRGRVWTTDAPFRETPNKVKQYADQGILAVDMEASALFTVARFREMAYAALMVVSDEVWSKERHRGFESPELAAGLRLAAGVILEVMA